LFVRRFNAPPGWPPPPNARWRPPKGWVPDQSWPEAPPGWAYWVNEHGRRVAGPIGRYGGPSRGWLVAGSTALLTFVLLVSCGVLRDDDPGDTTSEASSSSGSGPETAAPSPTTFDTPTPMSPTEPGPTSTPTPTGEPTSTPEPTGSATPTPVEATEPTAPPPSATPTQVVFYKNCGLVRAAGKAPLRRGDPGYSLRLDRDGDGIACDRT
jgi:Excalibur calcium-binding domain